MPECEPSRGNWPYFRAPCQIDTRTYVEILMDKDISIEGVRDRLTDSLADWGSQVSLLLNELETQSARAAELEATAKEDDERVESQAQQLKAQAELIATLQDDAREASDLRQQVRETDLENERLASELESKRELITALRRESKQAGAAKKELQAKDDEIAGLMEAQRQWKLRESALQGQLAELQEDTSDTSEVKALQADLDARKSLVDSLRSDLERLSPLEEKLTEKHQIIDKLEASVNRQAATIAELHQTVATWRRRFSALKGGQEQNHTAPQLPRLTETDVRALENMPADQTMAIDMSDSLEEARATARAMGK